VQEILIFFGLQTIVYNPQDQLLYGYLALQSENYFYNTSIITIDPKTARYKVVSMIDVPADYPFQLPNTFDPLLVNLNPDLGRAYALYTTQNTTSKCYYHNLKTIDIRSGKVLYSIGLGDIEWCPPGPELPEPWGLVTMTSYQ